MMFRIAWGFFVISAALGLLLRLQVYWPGEGLVYAHWMHAHSHVAFLGWVFNGFFALAVKHFVPREAVPGYVRLFWVTQVAVVGMLITFPLQGYARESILFSTLHLVCAGVFAIKLLRRNRAARVARPYLHWSFVFLALSALGPLALGPLAAAGLRESPWYTFSIYGYLHFQYNGWFVFFLLAVGWQWLHEQGGGLEQAGVLATCRWLAAGALLTLALSALWMNPPGWVFGVGLVGAGLQVVGLCRVGAGLRTLVRRLRDGKARLIMALALAALAGKIALQVLGGIPWVADLSSQRPVVIAFLHLVFLGFVTPALLAWAVEAGWVRLNPWARWALVLGYAGVVITELALFYLPAAALLGAPPWPAFSATLLVGASLMLLGATGLCSALMSRVDPIRRIERKG
jgi:hypothetical protein